MTTRFPQQYDFSSVLFDTLFGLVLFFAMEAFLKITDALHFIFYLFALLVVLHWWLMFKADDDIYGYEVTNSVTDIVFGIFYLLLLELFVLAAEGLNYQEATVLLSAIFLLNTVWALLWRYIGDWDEKDTNKIRRMERELDYTKWISAYAAILTGALFIWGANLTPILFITLLLLIYSIFIYLTFRWKIIDLNLF